jgi:hypothetical protein
MKSIAWKSIAVFAIAAYLGITNSQERTQSDRQLGRLVRDEPMPNVTGDKDGWAVIGGTRSLTVGRDELLIVTEARPNAARAERFLAFSTKGESNAVRVVDKPVEASRWVMERQKVGKGHVDPNDRFSNLTVKATVRFIVSDGPFKDCYLCIDEQNRLVLKKELKDSLVWKAEYEDRWDGK